MNRLFLLFGLHRSGSTCTAGVVHYLGVDMGQNEGLFENLDFVLRNDEILWSVEGSWDRPPTNERIQATTYPTERLQDFLAQHRDRVFGLKDPRILLTFDIWQPHLRDLPVTYVFIHRPFHSSVKSLAYRDDLSLEDSATILSPYLENFYKHRYRLETQGVDIIDVHYESLIKDPTDFVAEINRRLNVHPRTKLERVRNWISKDLRRF